MAGGSFCWIQWKVAQQEACVRLEVFKTNKQTKTTYKRPKTNPKQKTKPTNKSTDEDPWNNNTYMTYTNSRNGTKCPFHPKPYLNYSEGNNNYSWPPSSLRIISLSPSCALFLSEVANTWTEGRLIHQNLVCITGICRGGVRELRNHKHFWMGGVFFLKCMLKPTLNLLVNLLRTCFGVSL